MRVLLRKVDDGGVLRHFKSYIYNVMQIHVPRVIISCSLVDLIIDLG